MGIKYNKMKLVWLKQASTNQSFIQWLSPEGSLEDMIGSSQISVPVKVKVINAGSPTFSVTGGELPPGLTINPTTGEIYGKANNINGSYEFTLTATAGNATADRTFTANVVVNQAPLWATPAGSLGSQFDNVQVSVPVLAVDPEGVPVTYSVYSGSLPAGTNLDPATGVISGRLGSVQDDTTYFFTLRASDGNLFADRAFSYTTKFNAPPAWVTPEYPSGGYLGAPAIENQAFNFQLVATDATGGQTLTYTLNGGSLPTGLTLSNTGVISGTLPAVVRDVEFPFEVIASDGFKKTSRRFRVQVQKNIPPTWVSGGRIGQGFGGDTFTYTLVASDRNQEPVTYSLAANSALPGSLVLDANTGVISGGLPDVEETEEFSFTINASDGLSASPRAMTILTFKNAAPVWITDPDLGRGVEGYPVSIQLSALDPTGANRTPTYQSVSAPAGLSVSAGGLLSGTLSSVLADATYTFDVTARFGNEVATRTFTFVVENNIPPVWNTSSGEIVSELAKTYISYQLNAGDPNGKPVTYSLVSGQGNLPSGINLSAGGLVYGNLPNDAIETDYAFTVSASDGVTTPVDRAFSIKILPNLPPVWNTEAGSLGEAFETMPFTAKVSAYDPEGKTITYGLVPGNILPSGLSLNSVTGQISGTLPVVTQDSLGTFSIFADDGSVNQTGRTSRTFTIKTKFNSPPIFQTGQNLGTRVEGYAYDMQIAATGVGNGPMVYSLVSGALPNGLTLTPSGRIYGTLPASTNLDAYTFTVRAFNGIKDATRTFTLSVAKNLAPVWNTDAGSLGSFYYNKPVNLSVSATDPNGTPLVYTMTGNLPSGLNFANTGVISGKLNNLLQADATSTFTVTASDGILSANRTFSITQLADTAPVWITPAGSLGTTIKNKTYSYTVTAQDQEGSTMTYLLVSGTIPGGALSPSGVISGTAPNVSAPTTSTFTVRASDGIKTVERTFSITVDTDAPPVWQTPAGSIGSVLSGYNGTFHVSATDPEGLPLTYTQTAGNVPPNMVFTSTGDVAPQGGDVPLTYANATYTFTVEVSDGNNIVPRTFSLDVLANRDPVWVTASGSLGTYAEGAVVSNTVVATDPDGLPVIYNISNGALPSGLNFNGSTGQITGTLATVMSNTTSNFTITATDNKRSASRSFSYTVIFNSPPVWQTASNLGSYMEQTQANVTVTAVADGHPVTYALKAGSTLPSGVTLEANTGVISGLLPAITSTQVYSFTIVATDGTTNKTAERTFSLTSQDNVAPQWVTPAGSVLNDLAGTPVNITLVANDPNGTAVDYVFVSGELPNTVVFANTGTLTGTLPIVTNNTTYTFTVGAFDGQIRTDRTFTLTSQFDVAPVWQNSASLGSGIEGDAFNVRLIATDPNGKTITYTNTTAMPNGLALIGNATGAYVGGVLPPVTANTGFDFTLRANDGTMTTDQTFSLTVLDDRAPVWNTSSGSLGSVTERVFASYSLSATDPENRGVTYSLANSTTLPSGMSLSTANGTVSGTPDSVVSNTTTNFTVRASDPRGNATDRNFSVTVLASKTEYDQFSANTVLQVSMDGPLGFAPLESHGYTVTNTGTGAKVSNAVTKWTGINTAQVSPGNFSRVTHSGQLTCAGDLTIEIWAYPTAHAGEYNALFSSYVGSPVTNDDFILLTKGNGTLRIYIGSGEVQVGESVLAVNNWYHVAVSRQGLTTRVFVNGVLVGSTTAWTGAFCTGNQPATFGGYDSTTSYGFTGYLSDFRVTKGVARYTADFSVPTKPFVTVDHDPSFANVYLLMNGDA